jgi:hypothetical protein
VYLVNIGLAEILEAGDEEESKKEAKKVVGWFGDQFFGEYHTVGSCVNEGLRLMLEELLQRGTVCCQSTFQQGHGFTRRKPIGFKGR